MNLCSQVRKKPETVCNDVCITSAQESPHHPAIYFPPNLPLPALLPAVEDLLLWRDARSSGSVFAAVTLLRAAMWYTQTTIAVALLYMGAVAVMGTLVWAQAGGMISRCVKVWDPSCLPVSSISGVGYTSGNGLGEIRRFAQTRRGSLLFGWKGGPCTECQANRNVVSKDAACSLRVLNN